MDKIFQSAFRVIAYLGPEKDNCNMVFDECNDAGMRLFYSGLFYYSTLAHSDPQIRNRLYQRAREDGTFFLQFVKEHGNYVQTSSAAKLQGKDAQFPARFTFFIFSIQIYFRIRLVYNRNFLLMVLTIGLSQEYCA